MRRSFCDKSFLFSSPFSCVLVMVMVYARNAVFPFVQMPHVSDRYRVRWSSPPSKSVSERKIACARVCVYIVHPLRILFCEYEDERRLRKQAIRTHIPLRYVWNSMELYRDEFLFFFFLLSQRTRSDTFILCPLSGFVCTLRTVRSVPCKLHACIVTSCIRDTSEPLEIYRERKVFRFLHFYFSAVVVFLWFGCHPSERASGQANKHLCTKDPDKRTQQSFWPEKKEEEKTLMHNWYTHTHTHEIIH